MEKDPAEIQSDDAFERYVSKQNTQNEPENNGGEPTIVETPADNVAPTASTPGPVQASSAATSTTEKTLEQALQEKYGWKSIADVESALNAIPKEKEVEKIVEKQRDYKSEFSKRLDEYIEKGGTEADFIKSQSIDYNSLSDEQIIKQKMKREDSDLTDQEIDLKYKRQYTYKSNTAEDELTEEDKEEIDFRNILRKTEAKKYRNEFNSEKIKLAEAPAQKQVSNAEIEAQQLQQAKQWEQTVNKLFETDKKISFKVNVSDDPNKEELVDVGYDLNDEGLNSAKEVMTNSNKLFARYTAKDGGFDGEKFKREIGLLTNLEKALPAMLKSYHASKFEAYLKDLKNPDYSKNIGSAPKLEVNKELAVLQEFAAKI